MLFCFFCSLNFSLLGQSIPSSWELLEYKTTLEDSSIVKDTMYLSGKDSDTVKLTVRVELLIASNGTIKDISIVRTTVTFMEDRQINKEVFKEYEKRVLNLYQDLMQEDLIYSKIKNYEYKLLENMYFFVNAEKIYQNN